ncbi:MAG: plasmid partitioning protein RepB [Hyphomonas sp.]|jgi:ParB family chromosome partitioning protein|nr:plasmid partitioning protein RepB [Hyphomonas sp.]
MARKITFDAPVERQPAAKLEQEGRGPVTRPLMALERPVRSTGALSAISRSLDGLSEKAKRADQIEQKLIHGLTVVEIDPSLIDASFVPDRMELSDEQNAQFREAIRDNGQQSPILVRPKAGAEGRYEVAFGHRRLRAARELGIKVRAVVKQLSDQELVVAQGQENSSRTDLTFIERARFAARLEERGFSRDVIMSALSVDKAALSRLIALTTRLPPQLVEAIGPAPGFGRVRWAELADLLDVDGVEKAYRHIEAPEFKTSQSDQRFLAVYNLLRSKSTPSRVEAIRSPEGLTIGELSRSGRKLILAFDTKAVPEFGDFVRDKLATLFAEFQATRGSPR